MLPPEVVSNTYSNEVSLCLRLILDMRYRAWRRWHCSRGYQCNIFLAPLIVDWSGCFSQVSFQPAEWLMVVQSEFSCPVSVRASTLSFSSCMAILTSPTLLFTELILRPTKRVSLLGCTTCLAIRGQIKTVSLCCTEVAEVLAVWS